MADGKDRHKDDVKPSFGEQLANLSWNPEDSLSTIGKLYEIGSGIAEEQLAWYEKKQRSKKRAARAVRLFAVLLGTTGMAAPLMSATAYSPLATAHQWGYLAIAGAVLCLGCDRFFGLSSGWIRYMTTQLALRRTLAAYRFDWARAMALLRGQKPALTDLQEAVERVKVFVMTVHTEVEHETELWAREFQSAVADLEKAVRAQTESRKPGAVELTVSQTEGLMGVLRVSLDRVEVMQMEGSKCHIGSVAPGQHEVLVRGQKNGRAVTASTIVTVAPDQIARVPLALAGG